jgi:hypothetical protein
LDAKNFCFELLRNGKLAPAQAGGCGHGSGHKPTLYSVDKQQPYQSTGRMEGAVLPRAGGFCGGLASFDGVLAAKGVTCCGAGVTDCGALGIVTTKLRRFHLAAIQIVNGLRRLVGAWLFTRPAEGKRSIYRGWARVLKIRDLEAPGRISSGYATDAERGLPEMGKEIPTRGARGCCGAASCGLFTCHALHRPKLRLGRMRMSLWRRRG